jgi:site-specific recombinase XerD
MTDEKLTLGALVQRFFHERLVQQCNASAHTVASYRDTWRLLLTYLSAATGRPIAQLAMADLTAEAVLSFLDYLETERGYCVRSRNQRLAALKAFFHYAIFADPSILGQAQRVLELPLKRWMRRMLGYLTHEEMDAILAVPDRTVAAGRRIHALLLFMYNTGARVSEVTAVCVGDLRAIRHAPQVRLHGKGGKQRVVPLWSETANVLEQLVAERGVQERLDAPVFTNARGCRIARGGVTYLLHAAVQSAAEARPSLAGRTISPHTLRHTTAMHLLQSGVDLHLIRMWLGHVALDTTHQYVEADLEMKRQALAKGGITAATAADASWQPTDELMAFLDGLCKG